MLYRLNVIRCCADIDTHTHTNNKQQTTTNIPNKRTYDGWLHRHLRQQPMFTPSQLSRNKVQIRK